MKDKNLENFTIGVDNGITATIHVDEYRLPTNWSITAHKV